MTNCPICHTQLHNSPCPACGYDPSRDYGRYPTFAMLPGRAVPQSRREPDDAAACPGCGGKQFFFRPDAKELICVRCGHTLAVSAPQPAVKPAPVPDAVKPQAHRPVPSIKAIAAGASHLVGLRADGTVCSVGTGCDHRDWSDIRHIWAGGSVTLGARTDGTLVCTDPAVLKQLSEHIHR